jgi:hypothetical protein
MQSFLGTGACLIIFGASSAALFVGLKMLLGALKFRRASVVVQGKYVGDQVEDAGVGNDALSSHIYREKVAFDCPFTHQQRVVLGFTGSNVHSLQSVGEPMPVLVEIAPPHEARVKSFRHLYLLPLAMIVFGAPLAWLAAWFMFAR